MTDPSVIEQLAWELAGLRPGRDVAFLIDGNTAYFSAHSRRGHEPFSAIVRLIQGIHGSSPGSALRLLRNRIFATGAPTEMCHGMVSVAAKRLTAGIAPRNHGIKLQLDKFHEVAGEPAHDQADGRWQGPALAPPPEAPGSDADFMRRALELARQVPRSGPLPGSDRPIAALLVSGDGQLLGQAVNSNARNRTMHAEIRLLQEFWRRTGHALPRHSRIFTTLKPCKMCAGMIWEASEDISTLQVLFAERDDGPQARLTVLDPSTHERRRACQAKGWDALRDLEIERQLP